MLLNSFKYKTSGWNLSDITALKQTNLIVGNNASGKTRSINALKDVASFMLMKSVDAFKSRNFRTTLTFTDSGAGENWQMEYSFEIIDGKIVYELLKVCGVTLLKRNAGGTVLKGESINPPVDRLTVQVRRDRESYPEIEKLMAWAESVIVVSCSNINPFTSFSQLPDFINPLSMCDLVEKLSTSEKKRVIKLAKELGYDIQEIAVAAIGEIKLVAIKEKYVSKPIPSLYLSSGMLRVLYLLCFISHMRHDKQYRLLLIDDLGEGLDYRRATMLGKMVFDACEQEKIQLIASSNDTFLMDVVDISKWQILRRSKTKIRALNDENSREMFSYFRMTGLSNFDFFSSDFIDDYLSKAAK